MRDRIVAASTVEAGEASPEGYELLEPIGTGGFGAVSRALQRSTQQAVAIKFLRSSGVDERTRRRQVARFMRETEICAELHHPNIVRILDRGETANGRVYAVFERVRGETLEARLHRPMAATEAGDLMLQVLDALACIHARGIVHRDLKPSNVMVTFTGSRAHAKLLCSLALALAQHVLQPAAAPGLREHVLRFDPLSLQLTRHRVLRRPQCPDCGDPELLRRRAQTPPRLEQVPKQRPHRGGYRRDHADETFERYASLIDPVLGAVTYVSRLSSAQPPVYGSGHPAPVELDSEELASVRVCAGKGLTAEQARASAVALTRLLGFSARQYAERAQRNAAHGDRALWIPAPLAEDVEIDWTPAWSISSGARHFVPLSYCFSACPARSGARHVAYCGNGVAAGTCLEEALLQGLLELVERDAVAIWWYNRIQRPAVARESLPAVLQRALGEDGYVLDLTHDLGLPTFVAVRERRTPAGSVFRHGLRLSPARGHRARARGDGAAAARRRRAPGHGQGLSTYGRAR